MSDDIKWIGGVITDASGSPICEVVFNGEEVKSLREDNARLRALLREVLETYGKSWQEWCEECGGFNKHTESCLLGRIKEALK